MHILSVIVDYDYRRWTLCWNRGDNGDLEKADVQAIEEGEEELEQTSLKRIDVMEIEEYMSSPRLPRKTPFSAMNPLAELPNEISLSEPQSSSESSSESGGEGAHNLFKVRKWPTRWYWQFLVLLVRTFRQSRHVILSKLNLVQTVILTTVASIIWFQLPKHEDSISDRYGYVSVLRYNDNILYSHFLVRLQLFFMIVYWGFQPLFIATMSCKFYHQFSQHQRVFSVCVSVCRLCSYVR